VSTWSAPRALLPQEWPAFRAAVNRVFRPDGGDLTDELPLLFAPENRENLRVVCDAAGAIVAHAGCVQRDALVLKRRVRVGFIAAVFTVPNARRQGLGTRVLLDALGRARREADLVLASGDRDLYRRQGFEPAAPLARYRLPEDAPNSAKRSADLETQALVAEDLPAVMALYEGEDVHFVRSPDDWAKLCAAGRLIDAPATLSTVRRAGRIVAVIAAQNASTRPDGTPRPRRILEIAGDREAVVAAAPALADELLVPAYDSNTVALAAARGWVRTTRQFPITAEPLTAVARLVPWYGLNYL
jgi:predicted N-acetyltransferase YhbS